MSEFEKISLSLINQRNDVDRLLPQLEGISGKRGVAFTEAAITGRVNNTWRKGVDRAFLAGMRDIYGSEGISEEALYKASVVAGNDTVGLMIDTLYPSQRTMVSPLNEVALVSSSPADALEMLATAEDPRLRFELKRALALATVAAPIIRRLESSHIEDELIDVQRLLARNLYEGPIGRTDRVITHAQHDNSTNRALWVQDVDPVSLQRKDGSVHWKKHEQQMRPVQDVGYVMTEIHRKGLSSSIVKALREAWIRYENGGTDLIDPDEDVRDLMGMMFVAKSANNHEDQRVGLLMDRVVHILQSNKKNIKGIRERHRDGNDGDPFQSNDISYKRLMLDLDGTDEPLELMFFSERAFLDYRMSVGNWNPVKREFSGPAHSLYERNRILKLQPFLLPRSIYYPNNDDTDLDVLAEQGIKDEAERLRLASRVTPPPIYNY